MRRCLLLIASAVFALLASGSVRAEEGYYGLVESYGDGLLVVRTTQHSVGHWRVDGTTRVTGSVAPLNWVFVEVERSGHVRLLRSEERPTTHVGVVKAVRGPVLTVRSGNSTENWNVTQETILPGPSDFAVGDEVAVHVYRNHNLAEVRILKRGVK
ncbi:MAG TPA: hypothetical protein VFG59_20755 [Anaeromyxobacter sp.]|nr:hypothetical protein [Anaeromyxobacter sp.]